MPTGSCWRGLSKVSKCDGNFSPGKMSHFLSVFLRTWSSVPTTFATRIARLTPLLLAWDLSCAASVPNVLDWSHRFPAARWFCPEDPSWTVGPVGHGNGLPKVTSPNKSCHAKSRYLKRDPHIQNLHGIGTAVLNSFLEINLLVYKVVVANNSQGQKSSPKSFPNTTSNPECSKNNWKQL